MRFPPILLAAALLIGAATPQAYAGLFNDDEARDRIEKLSNELGGRVKQLESRVENSARSQIEFANQVETLRSELAKLRGDIDVMKYELEAAQKRQKDFYIDLDTRLRKLEAKGDSKADEPKAAVDPAAETNDYENALNLFKAVKYKEAMAAFQTFIKNYPHSVFLPSAHYWAASAHYQLREYTKAADLFAKVVAEWPQDPKAADALLGQANSQQEAGDTKGARKTLNTLAESYPASSAARIAKQRLKKK